MSEEGAVLRTRGPFYGRVPEVLIWLDDRSAAHACRLFAALDRMAGRDDRAWPGRDFLAERLHVSADTIDRAMRLLRQQGCIEIHRRGCKKSNVYTLAFPLSEAPSESAPVRSHPESESAPVRSHPPSESAPVRTPLKGKPIRDERKDTDCSAEIGAALTERQGKILQCLLDSWAELGVITSALSAKQFSRVQDAVVWMDGQGDHHERRATRARVREWAAWHDPAKLRSRAAMMDAMYDVEGVPWWAKRGEGDNGRIAKAVSLLPAGVSADEVRERAAVYPQVMGDDVPLTANALAKHWTRLTVTGIASNRTGPGNGVKYQIVNGKTVAIAQ